MDLVSRSLTARPQIFRLVWKTIIDVAFRSKSMTHSDVTPCAAFEIVHLQNKNEMLLFDCTL